MQTRLQKKVLTIWLADELEPVPLAEVVYTVS